jgi:hypothetical protein
MLEGMFEFGIGALVLVGLVLLVPKLLSWWERRQLDSSDGP